MCAPFLPYNLKNEFYLCRTDFRHYIQRKSQPTRDSILNLVPLGHKHYYWNSRLFLFFCCLWCYKNFFSPPGNKEQSINFYLILLKILKAGKLKRSFMLSNSFFILSRHFLADWHYMLSGRIPMKQKHASFIYPFSITSFNRTNNGGAPFQYI